MNQLPNQKKYLTHLDGMRGFAALIVCLFHVSWPNHFTDNWFIKYGSIWVDFFFVLSGYVISHVYPRLDRNTDVINFAIRRVARLYPLHLLTLLLVTFSILTIRLVLPAIWENLSELTQLENLTSNFFAHLFLVNSHGISGGNSYNVPSWSIGAEAWAYFMYALAGYLVFRYRIVAMLAVGLVSLVILMTVFDENIVYFQHYFGVLRALLGFSLGCLGYLFVSQQIKKTWNSDFLFVIILVASIWLISQARIIDRQYSYLFPFLFTLLIGIAWNNEGLVRRVLSTKPMAWLGSISYGVYMWHFLIKWAFTILIIQTIGHTRGGTRGQTDLFTGDVFLFLYVVTVFVVAYVSFHYFERPARMYIQSWQLKR